MKTIWKFYSALLLVISTISNITFLQGNGPQINYYQTTPIDISTYRPDIINPDNLVGGTIYFDLSSINSQWPDISASINAQQQGYLPFPTYYYYRHGNWNSNLGNGTFSSPSANPFFPTYSFISDNDVNRFYACTFIKLRDQSKKDLVTVRYGNINVYHNDNNAITTSVQDLQQGGVADDVGEFNAEDRYEDLTIMGSTGAVCVYRNLYNGFIDPTPYVFSIGAQRFKIKQIDDKSFPYPQINSNNRFDIITTQGSTVNIFLNNNNNGINSPQTFDAGFNILELEVADINNDGYNDIIVAGGGTSSSVAKVFINNTNGTINTTPVYTTPNNFISSNGVFLRIAASDLNNDGYNDLTFMGVEGQVKVYINSGSGSYFTQTAQQTITGLHNFASIDQIMSIDIYNTGGKALVYSFHGGGGAIIYSHWGLKVLNAVNHDIAPAPPIMKGSVYFDGTYNRPKIIITSNRGTLDFQKYYIYKSKASTGWNFIYCGETPGNEFIDNTEIVNRIFGNGDSPPPNCYYAVTTVDITNNISGLSNQVGYTVSIPVCRDCGVDDMSFVREERPEELVEKPREYKVTNFPNPFNPTTKIYFTLPKEANVKITVYNSLGKVVKVALDEFKYAGYNFVEFNGSELSTGVYFL